MSKADEMFEKLGYENIRNKVGNTFTAIYAKGDKRIAFYTDKTIECYDYYYGSDYISMQELHAINLKSKELGWIEE